MKELTAVRTLVRGQALMNDLVAVEALFGRTVVDAFFDRLTDEQRASAKAGFEPSRWYDDDIQLRLVTLLAERATPFELFAVGVSISRHNISSVQGFLARIVGPRVLLRRASALWIYWRDTGSMHVERFEEGAATVVVRDNPLLPHPAYATTYGGACGYMVAVAGAANVRLSATSVSASMVRYDVRWSRAPMTDAEGFSVSDAIAWCDARWR